MKPISKRIMQSKNGNQCLLTAVDLFAGGGGLTVGLKRAGFTVVSAVEIEEHAYSTYKANHPEVRAFKQDIREVDGASLVKSSPTGRIDLLAGCPPCQGFSSLTSKYRRRDPRNELIFEMSRLIEEIRPRIVMMENVPGLAQKGRKLLDDFIMGMERIGYDVSWNVLQVADYGVPQYRRRLVLLAGLDGPITLPEPSHSKLEEKGRDSWRVLAETIGHMPEPITLKEANQAGGPQLFNWHVTRNMTDRNLLRLKHAKPGEGRHGIPRNLRPDCHKNDDRGFGNVYGRLSWDHVSAAITGGCTTLSKGRFGHPDKSRTLSVREAALIQTFPEDYIIDTPYMEHACNIIGNALPCDFAHLVASQCFTSLQNP